MLLLLVSRQDLYDSCRFILSTQCDIIRGHGLCFCGCQLVSLEKNRSCHSSASCDLTHTGPYQTFLALGFNIHVWLFIMGTENHFTFWNVVNFATF